MRSSLKIGLDETTRHLTKRANNARHVAGYKRDKTCAKWLVVFVLGLTSAFACAEELGRLFFTPEQRAQLDYMHAHEITSDRNDRALMLNGIVQKQGGKRTVWINGLPQQAGSSDERTPESLSVPLPGQTRTVKLKVGQRVLLSPSASPDTAQPDTSDIPRQ